MVIVTTDKTSKFDQLHSVRYKLEHNQLSRLKPESDKINVFQTLDKHIKCSKDWEVKQFAVQLIHVSAHHMSSPILKQRILDYLFFFHHEKDILAFLIYLSKFFFVRQLCFLAFFSQLFHSYLLIFLFQLATCFGPIRSLFSFSTEKNQQITVK